MSLKSHRVLSLVGVKSGWPPLAMADNLIAVATERTSSLPHLTCPWLGTVRRGGISQAREVQTLRAPVILQPSQNCKKQRLAQYSKQLMCGHGRCDATRQRRLNTIVERAACKLAVIVGVSVDAAEVS
jgi:hypothetical protein